MSSLLHFSQLRNNVWNSFPARALMQQAGLLYGNFFDPRSYEQRHFTTRVQETASLHTTGPGSCISEIQPLKFQKTSEHEQSATVLIFDTETTGYFTKDNRIVELALRDLSGGKNSTFETLINPQRNIPKFVSAVTNISTALVCRPDVPRFADVLPLLLAYVRSRQTPGKPVIWVAHKAKTFDAPFLAQEFGRCSAQMPEDWLFVDSHCLARKLPKLPKSDENIHLLNLGALSKRYGISVETSAHRAMQDVTAMPARLTPLQAQTDLAHSADVAAANATVTDADDLVDSIRGIAVSTFELGSPSPQPPQAQTPHSPLLHENEARKHRVRAKRVTDSAKKLRRSLRLAAKEEENFIDMVPRPSKPRPPASTCPPLPLTSPKPSKKTSLLSQPEEPCIDVAALVAVALACGSDPEDAKNVGDDADEVAPSSP